jgi:hypothetical protein
MICPSCKNPIEENKHICEWCGHLLNNDKPIENSPIQPFENELLSLIKAGKRAKAIKLYSKYTFKDLSTASFEIQKLINDSGLSIIDIEKSEKRLKLQRVFNFIILMPLFYSLYIIILIFADKSLLPFFMFRLGEKRALLVFVLYTIGVIIYFTIKRKNNKNIGF